MIGVFLQFETLNHISQIHIQMKKDIHPKAYRPVVFKDIATEDTFLTKSCVNTKDTITWEDGKEYPLVKVEVSSFSHPFFTGKVKFVDTAGRIDKFNKKFSNFKK
jgi:large subunit ribosomal protein L31